MSKQYQSEPLLNDDEHEHESKYIYSQARNISRKRSLPLLLSISLLVSLSLNLLQALSKDYASIPMPWTKAAATCQSEYASLADKEIDVKWLQSSAYTSSNTSERDHMWDAINHDSGIVAVQKSWALEKGLELGADFPWDKNKTIYFVNAFHSLHCIKNIYRSLMEHREGLPQTFDEHHLVHCLDQLRADTECTADDTLRFTTPDRNKTTAVGQIRQCRDFKQLRAWTEAHSGCYRYGDPLFEDAQESQLPRKRFCPEGSPDLDTVRAYYGKGPDWTPANEPVYSWFDKK